MSGALQLLADSSPEVPGTRTLIIVSSNGLPTSVPAAWLPWAIGIPLFCAAALVAYRRAAPAVRDVPSRRRRILLSGLAWAVTLALMFAPHQYAASWRSQFGLDLILRTAALFLFGIALLGALDLMLDYFRPLRRREWVAIGPLLFAVFLPTTIFAMDLATSFTLFAQAGPGLIALAGAAAGFVWWAWLPAFDAKLAYVFE